MRCRKSFVYTDAMHTKNGASGANVRLRSAVTIFLECLFIFTICPYAQPKTLFIHRIHRVIHSFSSGKCRNYAVSSEIIHIIHRLSTTLIPSGFSCGYSCGYPFRQFPACLQMCHSCIFMHVRACSCGNCCFIRSAPRPKTPIPKVSKVTKMSNPQRIMAKAVQSWQQKGRAS